MKNNRVAYINQVFLATILTFIFGSYLLHYIEQGTGIIIPTFVRMIYSQLILLLPAVIYLCVNKIPPVQFIRLKKVNFITIILLVLLGFFVRPLMNLLSVISMIWVENTIEDTATQLLSEVNFFLALLFIAVIPAILEEFVYRGVFYNEYRKVNTRKAVLLSGLLFGVMHMNLNQFIYAFFMGVIFAMIIEATDSILASMIVHFTINGSSLIFLEITPWLQEQAGYANSTTLLDTNVMTREEILKLLPSLVVPAIMALIISLLLYYGIVVYNKRSDVIKRIFSKEENEKKTEKLITAPLVAGLVICIFTMILSAVA